MAGATIVFLVLDVFVVNLGEKLSLRPFIRLVTMTAGAQRPAVAGGFGRIAEGGKIEPGAAVVAAVAVERLFAGGHLVEKAHVALGIGEPVPVVCPDQCRTGFYGVLDLAGLKELADLKWQQAPVTESTGWVAR